MYPDTVAAWPERTARRTWASCSCGSVMAIFAAVIPLSYRTKALRPTVGFLRRRQRRSRRQRHPRRCWFPPRPRRLRRRLPLPMNRCHQLANHHPAEPVPPFPAPFSRATFSSAASLAPALACRPAGRWPRAFTARRRAVTWPKRRVEHAFCLVVVTSARLRADPDFSSFLIHQRFRILVHVS